MKYFSILFVFVALMSAGVAKAQSSTSTLNGTSYTFVLNDVDNASLEIIDKFTFSNNKVVSDKYSTARGYTSGNVIEKVDGNSTYFEVTLTHPTEGTVKFSGRIMGTEMYGDAVINANGQSSNLVFRGLTTQAWQDAMKAREQNGQ